MRLRSEHKDGSRRSL